MIKSLTSLRGIFILFIFFHHCLNLYPGGGSMAVAFFFVLGGFSMTLGYKDKITDKAFDYKKYLTRRCIKFYPLHWICLIAALPFALLSFNIKQIPIFVINAALIQTWIPIKEVYFSFNAVSWYLSNTMFFAVVFPFVFRWIAGASPKGKRLIAGVMTVIYVVVALLIPEEKYHAILYISPYMRLMDFMFGIFLALGYLKLKDRSMEKWNNAVCQIAIVSLIVLLVVESSLLSENATLFAPVYWIPVALLIVIASLSERVGGGQILQNKWLQRLGELSFIIFMIHQIILRYTTILFEKILHLENDIIYVVFTLTMTILVSTVVDKYLLKPITQWLTKRNQQSMIARS